MPQLSCIQPCDHHRAVFFVHSHLKQADERDQSVLRRADEEPQAPGVWPSFNLGQISQRYQDARLECRRVLHVHLSISNLLLLFVSSPTPNPGHCLSHRARPPGEKEVCTFCQVRMKQANAGGLKGAC